VTLKSGSKLKITCNALYSEWFFKKLSVSIPIHQGPVLIIYDVQKRDEGTYVCQGLDYDRVEFLARAELVIKGESMFIWHGKI